MPVFALAFALAFAMRSAEPRAEQPAAAAINAPDYARDVVPILENNCLRCHSLFTHQGGLVLDTYEELMKGGDKGPSIVPGRSDESRLILMVEGRVKPKMPQGGDLAPDELRTLRAWVDAGAPFSEPPALEDRIEAVAPEAALPAPITGLAFSPDGRTLAVPGYRQVRLMAVETGPARGVRRQPDLPALMLTGPRDLMRSVAYSPDGKSLAGGGGTPGASGEILFWGHDAVPVRSVKGHRDSVYQIAFSHDGTKLATTSYDRLVRLWDVASGRPLNVFKEHTEAVYTVAFSPDDRLLASGAADRSVKIWNVETGKRLYTLSDALDAIAAVVFNPSGQELSASGADKTIRTWEVRPDGVRLLRSIVAHQAGVLQLAYSPDGARLASSGVDRQVKIWNAATGAEQRVLETQHDWPQALAWSPDGRSLAVGRYDGSVTIYDASNGRRLSDPIPKRATAP